MDVFATYNDWIRFLILIAGMFIGGFTVGLAMKKWQEVLGVVTLLCSIAIPSLVEANIWSIRSHSMYGSDWEIIRELLNSPNPQYKVMFSLYIILPVLWMICLSQIIRIVLASRKLRS